MKRETSKSLMVGVTGGMGAGKILVTRIFSVLRIPSYDSDSKARTLMKESPELVRQVKQLLGEEAYLGDQLNRDFVAEQIFNDDFLLEALNHIVHPAVHKDACLWHDTFHGIPYTIREAALLFESGAYLHLDYVINVAAPEEVRIDRIMDRDGHSEDQIRSRISRQWSESQRNQLADFEIINDGQHLLIPQIVTVHRALLEIIRINQTHQ